MLRTEALFWISTCMCVTVFSDSRLMGGEETSIDLYPYMAGFERWNYFECASTIIHKTWAMTAGHCVTGNEDSEEVYLRVGTSYRGSGGSTVPVDKIMKHEEQKLNDIALLLMGREFPLGETVKTVGLPGQGADVEVNKTGMILGWGYQAPNQNSGTRLRRVEVTVLKREECQGVASLTVTNAVLCARPTKAGSDACIGDSGGPLVVGDVQVGIISAPQCTGDEKTVTLFTNVGHFRQSIDNIIASPPLIPRWSKSAEE